MIEPLQTSAMTTENSTNSNSGGSPRSPLKMNPPPCKNETEMIEIKIVTNETQLSSPGLFTASRSMIQTQEKWIPIILNLTWRQI